MPCQGTRPRSGAACRSTNLSPASIGVVVSSNVMAIEAQSGLEASANRGRPVRPASLPDLPIAGVQYSPHLPLTTNFKTVFARIPRATDDARDAINRKIADAHERRFAGARESKRVKTATEEGPCKANNARSNSSRFAPALTKFSVDALHPLPLPGIHDQEEVLATASNHQIIENASGRIGELRVAHPPGQEPSDVGPGPAARAPSPLH